MEPDIEAKMAISWSSMSQMLVTFSAACCWNSSDSHDDDDDDDDDDDEDDDDDNDDISVDGSNDSDGDRDDNDDGDGHGATNRQRQASKKGKTKNGGNTNDIDSSRGIRNPQDFSECLGFLLRFYAEDLKTIGPHSGSRSGSIARSGSGSTAGSDGSASSLLLDIESIRPHLQVLVIPFS